MEDEAVQAETYRQMHDIAVNDLGYESILEALEACPPTHDPQYEGDHMDAVGLRELALLYNHAHDDSRQFTRWQMIEAIAHGRHLAALEASSRQEERLASAVKDFRWRANQCRTNLDAYDSSAAAIWDLAADALEGK